MVKPNGIWDKTKNNLHNAIERISDGTTEIVVVPFAFDLDYHSELEGISADADAEGKAAIYAYLDNLPKPNINTKTFHSDAINDFYNNRVDYDKVTYLFLMTDGESEDNGKFEQLLSQWNDKYGINDVYGFYVMLNPKAHNDAVSQIIDLTPHLWQVDDADVSVNPLRLQDKAVFNARNDKYFDLNLYGEVLDVDISLEFESSAPYKVHKVEKLSDRLRVFVGFDGDVYSLPSSQDCCLNVKLERGKEYDFLVTEKVFVKCESKREKSLKVSVR